MSNYAPKHFDDQHDGDSLNGVKLMQWQEQVLSSPKNRLAVAALSTKDPKEILRNVDPTAYCDFFNTRIEIEPSPITNQGSSSRCWIFAAMNVFRTMLMKRLQVESLELSEGYIFFWDRIERSNFFLEQIIDTVELSINNQLVETLMITAANQGGQWDMAIDIVEKYGLVPEVLYADSFNAEHPETLDFILGTKLRADALRLRQTHSQTSHLGAGRQKEKLKHMKEEMLHDVYKLLIATLRPPPSPYRDFSWTFEDKGHRYRNISMTPLQFAQQVSRTGVAQPLTPSAISVEKQTCTLISKLPNSLLSPFEFISLVNDPRYAYSQLLTVPRRGNLVGGRALHHINSDIKTLKAASISMLRNGIPVWFTCDFEACSDTSAGILDPNLFDFKLGLDINLSEMNKRQRIEAGQSWPSHVMVLTGVHVAADGQTAERWRVQDTHGEMSGRKGYIVMADHWFDDYLFHAVVHPSFVSQETRDVLKKSPIELPLWDPMGSR